MMPHFPAADVQNPAINLHSGAAEIKRSEMWFEDGNVVVQVEDTQFRVHRSILSRKSEVFRDMFSLAQPGASGEGSVDGCPVVVFHDNKLDLALILSALYGDLCYQDMSRPLSIAAVSALLRLGDKYALRELRDAAVSRLCLEFPNVAPGRRSGYTPWTYIQDCPGAYQKLAALVYDEHILSVQGSLYFDCVCHLDFLELVRGYISADGTMKTLPQELMELLVMEKQVVSKMQRVLLAKWVEDDTPTAGCRTRSECRRALARIINCDSSLWFAETWDAAEGMCVLCRNSAKAAFETVRDEMWDEVTTLDFRSTMAEMIQESRATSM